METYKRYYIGTELKLALTIECEGFDMDNDPWTATVKRGNNSIVCDQVHNSVKGEDGQWYILINTKELGVGVYVIVVDIDVVDTDFDDNLRHETYWQELFAVYNV